MNGFEGCCVVTAEYRGNIDLERYCYLEGNLNNKCYGGYSDTCKWTMRQSLCDEHLIYGPIPQRPNEDFEFRTLSV